jgi:hypothetical protein
VKFNSFFDILGAVVILAIVTDIVTSTNSAKIVTSSGNAFSGIIHSALGK